MLGKTMFDLLFPAVKGSIMPISPLIFPAVSMGLGMLGGLGTSPRAEAAGNFMGQIDQMMPELGQTAFGKQELLGIGKTQADKFEQAGDIAAAGIAPGISESTAIGGTGRGQDASSMFLSALAPVKAKGIQMGQQNLTQLLGLFANMDATAKGRLLQAMGLKGQQIGQLEEQNQFQRAISGGMAGADVGLDMMSNFMQFEELQDIGGEGE